MSKPIQLRFVQGETEQKLVDILAEKTSLSKMKVKGILEAGGVWLTKPGAKKQRIRRASYLVKKGEKVEFNFNPNIDFKNMPQIKQVFARYQWGVWFKPANVLSCGGPFGDKGCVLDQVTAQTGKKALLVHRLDRETAGLTIVAYTPAAQKKLSEFFREGKIEKTYQAIVLGEMLKPMTITKELDGKSATSHIAPLSHDEKNSIVEIVIETGRTHQIRRHLDMVKHPVMGDPKYGRKNSNEDGLQLMATELKFKDPFDNQIHHIQVTPEQSIF